MSTALMFLSSALVLVGGDAATTMNSMNQHGPAGASPTKSCVLIDTDGDEWDFTALGGMKNIRGPPQSSLYGDWIYFWDFCATVAPPPPPVCTAVGETVAYRLEDYPGTGALCQQLGPATPQNLAVRKLGGVPWGVEVTFIFNTYTLTMDIMNDEAAGTETLPDRPASGGATVQMNWAICLSCLVPSPPPCPPTPPGPPPPSALLAQRTIVCADPAGPGNPTECSFTAPETGSFSFLFAAAAAFDIVKVRYPSCKEFRWISHHIHCIKRA